MEGEVALRAQTALSSLSPRLFGGSGEAAVSVVEGSLTMTIDYTSGPFTGKQVIAVGDDSVSASGNVKTRSVYRIASRRNESHLGRGQCTPERDWRAKAKASRRFFRAASLYSASSLLRE